MAGRPSASLVHDINWAKTSDSPFTLSFTDPNNSNITMSIVGTDGGSDPNTFLGTITRVGNDVESGTAKRIRTMGMTSTLGASYSVEQSLTNEMLNQFTAWFKQQWEDFLERPIAGLNKTPYSSAYGK